MSMTDVQRSNTVLFATGDLANEQTVIKEFASKNGSRVLKLKGVPVFRSGTFRDSMGDQMTWESLHMDQMKFNFEHLFTNGAFSDVPVRNGHPGFFDNGSPDSVVGYHDALYTEERINKTDGQKYTYLLADYTIMDPSAIEKINLGLWRNRSAEVGRFTTNAEASFWPTYQGVAYVDIPAVQGLNDFAKAHQSSNYSITLEENDVTTATPTAPVVAALVAPVATNVAPTPVTDPAPVLTAEQERLIELGRKAESDNLVGAHSASTSGFQFKVNGSEVKDFSAVQRHIETLETAQATLDAKARTDFVSGLAATGQITQPRVETLSVYASSLSGAQFGEWKKTWDDVPQSAILQTYGQQDSTPTPVVKPGPTASDDDNAMIAQFKLMPSMTPDAIKKTAAYRRLIAADASYTF